MESQCDAAIWAAHHGAAESALQIMCVASPIDEEKRLSAGCEVGHDCVAEPRCQHRRIPLGSFGFQVDELDERQWATLDPLVQLEQAIAAGARVVMALDRGRGRAEDCRARRIARTY